MLFDQTHHISEKQRFCYNQTHQEKEKPTVTPVAEHRVHGLPTALLDAPKLAAPPHPPHLVPQLPAPPQPGRHTAAVHSRRHNNKVANSAVAASSQAAIVCVVLGQRLGHLATHGARLSKTSRAALSAWCCHRCVAYACSRLQRSRHQREWWWLLGRGCRVRVLWMPQRCYRCLQGNRWEMQMGCWFVNLGYNPLGLLAGTHCSHVVAGLFPQKIAFLEKDDRPAH